PPAAPPATAGPGDPTRGEMLFGERGCNGCHTIKGVGGQVGPDLSKVGVRDLARERPGRTWPGLEAYIRESIEKPNAYVVPRFPSPSPMPPAELLLPAEQDRRDIIAFLLTLK
ncbi:MAG: cytochrome c, partial [Armatimonadetes bacterium]|nr:cytochrome c [Armatimonadota bacterium]